jgi:hypothetical protein
VRAPLEVPPGLVFGTLVVVLGVLVLLGRRDRLKSGDDARPEAGERIETAGGWGGAPVTEDLALAVVDAAIAEAAGLLRAELEPRLAVRCAYAAVAEGLGRTELARGAAESEEEFLARHLGDLDPDAQRALARLTAVFERARFGSDQIGEAERAAALADLEALRAGTSRGLRG